uniref:Uncharacterized protein n=1 Tax=Aureoumbra lagunensis TaxID=44058 RepID=A0A7S3NIC0_9STRA
MNEIDERFAAEQRRHWQNKDASAGASGTNKKGSNLGGRFGRSSLGNSVAMDPRAKLRPEGKPYAKMGGIFDELVSLLPLENGEEIEKFETRLSKFTRYHGPLALASTRDQEARPLIWYAVDTNDPIAAELLLSHGAASSAFSRIKNGGKTAFELAYSKRYERVVRVLNNWAHRELADVMDNVDHSSAVDSSRNNKFNHTRRNSVATGSNGTNNFNLYNEFCRPGFITTCECPLCSPSADGICNPCICLLRRTAPTIIIGEDEDNEDDDDDDDDQEEEDS